VVRRGGIGMRDIDSIKTDNQILEINYNNKGIFIIYPTILFLLLIIIFLIFGKKEIFVEVPSVINTYSPTIEVLSDENGIVKNVRHKDGAYVESGETILELSLEDKENHEIIATSDGYLQFTEPISQGMGLNSGDPLFSVTDIQMADLYIQGFVPIDMINGIKHGQSANFLIQDGIENETNIINSEIDVIGKVPSANDEGGFYLIESKIIDHNNNLVLGMSGNLNIILDEVSYLSFLWNRFF